jgi:hypothetical protein
MDKTTRVRVDLVGTLFLEVASIYRRRLDETVHDIGQRVAALRDESDLEQHVQDYAIVNTSSDVIEQARAVIGPALESMANSLQSIWSAADACGDMLVHDLVGEPALLGRTDDCEPRDWCACLLWDYRQDCGATGHPDGFAAWLERESDDPLESESTVVRGGTRRGPSRRHARRVLTSRR